MPTTDQLEEVVKTLLKKVKSLETDLNRVTGDVNRVTRLWPDHEMRLNKLEGGVKALNKSVQQLKKK